MLGGSLGLVQISLGGSVNPQGFAPGLVSWPASPELLNYEPTPPDIFSPGETLQFMDRVF